MVALEVIERKNSTRGKRMIKNVNYRVTLHPLTKRLVALVIKLFSMTHVMDSIAHGTSDNWYIDLRMSNHMTHHGKGCNSHQLVLFYVFTGDDTELKITHMENLLVKALGDVLYVINITRISF